MEQRKQNITCVMEELKKKQTKNWNIGSSCNGKRIMAAWVWLCLIGSFQSRLTVCLAM